MKKILILLFLLVFVFKVEGAVPTRTYTYTSGNTISPSEVTTNEDNIFSYLSAGVEAIATNTVVTSDIVDDTIISADIADETITTSDIKDGTIVNADISSSAAIVGSKLDLSAPGAIGGTTAAAGSFTTLSATGLFTLTSGQIAFPGTASASAGVNTLDDYEEGTFTATLTAGTSGTITVNSTVDTVSYTKIGRIVHIQCSIGVSSVSSPVGALTLGTLPFAVSNLTENSDNSSGSLLIVGGTGNTESLICAVVGGGTTISLYENVGTGTTYADDLANHITTNTSIIVGITYISE